MALERAASGMGTGDTLEPHCGWEGHVQPTCASWSAILACATLSDHAFVREWGGRRGVMLAESAPKTPRLKSSLGKLLMAGSAHFQEAHQRSPAQLSPTCVALGAWARQQIGISLSLVVGLLHQLAGGLRKDWGAREAARSSMEP